MDTQTPAENEALPQTPAGAGDANGEITPQPNPQPTGVVLTPEEQEEYRQFQEIKATTGLTKFSESAKEAIRLKNELQQAYRRSGDPGSGQDSRIILRGSLHIRIPGGLVLSIQTDQAERRAGIHGSDQPRDRSAVRLISRIKIRGERNQKGWAKTGILRTADKRGKPSTSDRAGKIHGAGI